MFDWKKFFNIRIDSAPADELRDRIESDSTVTGANLVILIAAILIACVGLNMDSNHHSNGRNGCQDVSYYMGCPHRSLRRHRRSRRQYKDSENERHSRRCHRNSSDASSLHGRLRHCHAFRSLLHRGSLPLLHQRLLYHALRLLHLQTSGRPHERNDFTGALPFPAPYPAAPWHRHYHTKHLHGRYDRP